MRGGLVFAPVVVPFGVAFGLFGASFGMMIGSAPIVRRMGEATGTDRSTRRRIRRVVLGGRPDQLSDEEQRRATRWAAIVAPWFPYSAVEGVTALAGTLLIEAALIGWPPRSGDMGFHTIHSLTIATCVVAPAVFLPLNLRRAQRAKRWAAMHAGL
jgi:hypothetical protein